MPHSSLTAAPHPQAQLIGSGAYGTVYRVIINSAAYALKRITSQYPGEVAHIRNKELAAHVLLFSIDPSYEHHIPLLEHDTNGIDPHTSAPNTPPVFRMLYPCGTSSLYDLMHTPSQRFPAVKPYLEQIAAAISFLDSHHVSHGDVKSDNVVLFLSTDQGTFIAKLIDYPSVTIIQQPYHTAAITATYPAPSLILYDQEGETGNKMYTMVTPHLDQYAHALMVAESFGLDITRLHFAALNRDSDQILEDIKIQMDLINTQDDPIVAAAVARLGDELSKLVGLMPTAHPLEGSPPITQPTTPPHSIGN